MDVRGQFGDIFGGVNALFAGLAFAGVIYTIFLQKPELELQRKELDEASELSATSTLVDIYSTRLKPLWEQTEGMRMEIAYLELKLDSPKVSENEKLRAKAKLQEIKENLEIQEGVWSGTQERHQQLADKFEMLVRQKSQGNEAEQKPSSTDRVA